MNLFDQLQAASVTTTKRHRKKAANVGPTNIRNAAKERYREVFAEPKTCPQGAAALGISAAGCKTVLKQYEQFGWMEVVGQDETSRSNNKPKLWRWKQ